MQQCKVPTGAELESDHYLVQIKTQAALKRHRYSAKQKRLRLNTAALQIDTAAEDLEFARKVTEGLSEVDQQTGGLVDHWYHWAALHGALLTEPWCWAILGHVLVLRQHYQSGHVTHDAQRA